MSDEAILDRPVTLFGNHPHAGEQGHLVRGDAPETIRSLMVAGRRMFLIELTTGEMRGSRTYALRENIQLDDGRVGRKGT